MDAVLPEITQHLYETLKSKGVFSLLSSGECPHVEGIWGAGSAAILAALIRENPLKNFVVLTSTQKAAQNFQDDFALFSTRPTLFFPWLNPRNDLQIQESEEESASEILSTFIPDVTVGERLRVLKAFLGAGASESSQKAADSAKETSFTSETLAEEGKTSRKGKTAGKEKRRGKSKDTAEESSSGAQNVSRVPVVIAPIQSLLISCPSPEALMEDSLFLRRGANVSMDSIAEWLLTHGFQNTTAVEFPGEFFARGGLIDIFAIDWEKPLRIEFFGDEIDSIREFDLETQRSLNALESIELASCNSMFDASAEKVPFTAYLSEEDTIFLLLEPEDIQLQGRRFYQSQENPERLFTQEEVYREVLRFPFLSASALGMGTFGESIRISMESVERFSGDFAKVREELDRFGVGQTVYLLCPNEAEQKRLETIFEGTHLARKNALKYRLGMVSDGVRFVAAREMVLSSSALFHRQEIRRSAIAGKKSAAGKEDSSASTAKAIDAFTDLQEGDYVVHVSFGIARYRGLKLLEPLKNKNSQTRVFSGGSEGASSTADAGRGVSAGVSPGRQAQSGVQSGGQVGGPSGGQVSGARAESAAVGRILAGKGGRGSGAGSGSSPNAAGAEEHMVLEFRDSVYVYVPISKIALVQKYICSKKTAPNLSTYGGKVWARMKQSVAESVQDLASEMLEIQAERQTRPGISFPIETEMQNEFDSLFPFTETADQLRAIRAIREDMASARPMDRLLCGDVGFGKTEVAMRAAFTAVEAGYQVGIMAPTTVLTEQHLRTFRRRMATFPVTIESLSRFSTAAQQKETLKRLAEGKIDILIGTHRIASSDVKFQNLGLFIIDEEQLFGVEMKESIKRFRASVDLLTMTATPIPRTLHMSMLGIRDISSLETPPADRRAIETRVTRFQNSLVKNAVMREIDRNGQIYFIHNRIADLEEVAQRLKELVPEARIAIGHAQMPERQLERVMLSFINHEIDVLVSTTIVESGLDIPNANTIFIDEANRYGLAELHQLRGRVGRFKNHAYCYLLVKENAALTEIAVRRLKAIEEFAHLGSGFSIAMRDLEIRGAGNILGTMQSGQIGIVGYELYCDLLDAAVRKLRRLPPRETVDVDVSLPLTAYLPHQYVLDMRVKMELYRRLSRLTRLEQIDDFEAELLDRFGKLPLQAHLLLKLYRVRILAHQHLIYAIHRDGDFLVLEFYSKKALEPAAARGIGRENLRLRFVDERTAYLPLDEETANSSSDSEKMLNYIEMLLRDS